MRKIKIGLIAGLGIVQFVTVPSVYADTNSETNDQDVALNQPYTVTTTIVDSRYHAIETGSFPDNGTKLTDGDTGPSSWGRNGSWVGYLRQDRHDVVVDLGDEQTIHKVDAWFLQDNGAGIRFPQTVSFSLSDNGVAWQNVGSVNSAIPLSDSVRQKQEYAISGLNVSARYVKYTFYTTVWSFLSEVEAWGVKGIQPGASPVTPTPPAVEPTQGYPLAGSKQAGGKHHEVLIYNGYYPKPGFGTWSVDSFLPYVGYIDQNNQITDYMFDSFLFLPFGNAPSGRSYGDGTSTQSDWKYYADQLFQIGQQLDALDQAVATVKAVLPNRNYSAKVVIAIPYPGTQSNWGNGLDFNPNDVGQDVSLANRVSAVNWYIDYVINHWNAARYQNIQLSGFYWYPENIFYSKTPNDEKLIQQVGAIVHSKGDYTFDWIPYNESEGFRNWAQDSFDNALMQPNYAWGAGADRLENNAVLAKHYGLGVEMEFDSPVLNTNNTGAIARDNYIAYLDAAYRYHYQNSFLAWYQGYQVLYYAERSAVPDIRQIYDETYQFINGTYQPSYRPGPGDTGTVNLNPVDGELPSGESRHNPNPEAELLLAH